MFFYHREDIFFIGHEFVCRRYEFLEFGGKSLALNLFGELFYRFFQRSELFLKIRHSAVLGLVAERHSEHCADCLADISEFSVQVAALYLRQSIEFALQPDNIAYKRAVHKSARYVGVELYLDVAVNQTELFSDADNRAASVFYRFYRRIGFTFDIACGQLADTDFILHIETPEHFLLCRQEEVVCTAGAVFEGEIVKMRVVLVLSGLIHERDNTFIDKFKRIENGIIRIGKLSGERLKRGETGRNFFILSRGGVNFLV